jgi:von Willebrand factor type A domain
MINSRRYRSLFAGLGFMLTVSMLTSCANSVDKSIAAPEPPVSTAAPLGPPKGWIGGEPTWSGTEGATLEEAGADTEAMAAMSPAASPTGELDAAATSIALPGDVLAKDEKKRTPDPYAADGLAVGEASSDPARSITAIEPDVVNNTPLRAGSRDDNADFDKYIEYRKSFPSYEVPVRELSVEGRTVVTVTTASKVPCAGCAVSVKQGQRELGVVRTAADGSARVHPVALGGSATEQITLSVGSQSITTAPGAAASLTAGTASADAPLDVMFLLDATGSMGDEIDRLKTSIDEVAAQISALEGARGLRMGMTIFRDEGDDFVTSTYDFTNNVADFRAALANVAADGGGDTPEAVDEALADALDKPTWRPAGEATQLIFLVGDAGPQVQRQVRKTYADSAKDAATRGIKIVPIASSNTDDLAEYVFRQVAQFTGGRFVFMSYGAEGNGAAVGGSTNIDTTSIDELPLDQLIVKLVSDEVSARRGVTPTPVIERANTTTTISQQQ